jgi:hypothetical protein
MRGGGDTARTVKVTSRTSRLALIRDSVTDFGKVGTLRLTCHAMATCAADLPYFSPMAYGLEARQARKC